MSNMKLDFETFKARVETMIADITAMELDDPLKGAGTVASTLEELYKVAKKKYQAVLAGKDLALMAKKTERQVALDKVIPDIVKCIKESDSLDDATARLVADRFYDEYVLDNLGHIRGKFIKFAPSVLSQVKISFGVFLSTKKAMDSIKKYIFREEVVCRDYPSMVRQVLASLFHTVLAPYKGVLI